LATSPRQPELRRRFSARLLVALTLSACFAAAAAAQDGKLASGYQPNLGEPFFLLSDAVIGSGEQARVRLELTASAAAQDIGGVDIAVYRIGKPLDFLKAQKNLHRIDLQAAPRDEGVANVLTHLWDASAKKARLAWQGLFNKDARAAVTQDAPGAKRADRLFEASRFEQPPRFKPPAGMQPIAQFRYPVARAKTIRPPEGVKLPGSSSEFKLSTEGNVYVPLGRLAPGLYAVEAALGAHRAATVVFVSDTMSVAKSASQQLLVWTVDRASGAPVGQVQLLWTDGVGVLQSAATDASGLANFRRASPEQSYVIGQDAQGGVFITENFYYDSEIYNTKLYAVTDRPLYRPGETVFVKFIGREFTSARLSQAAAAGEIALTVFDPHGLPVADARTALSPDTGGDTRFALPSNAVAGGYELRFAYKGNSYSAAFRVSEYQKPHFEITVLPDKADYKTGEAVTGRLQLNYPDGAPVKNAMVDLTGRAQALTMVDGELDYAGPFPLKLTTSSMSTDSAGVAKFSLPAAAAPSRYILSALATDGAAYRVRASRELLIERAAAVWSLRARQQFSAVNEKVSFQLAQAATGGAAATHTPPTQWDWVRLEDRATAKGALANPNTVELAFDKPGTYTVTARNQQGQVLAATSHWISGAGIRPAAGNIEMVSNQARYAPGDTAQVLITFPDAVAHALFTLERDAIERTALLNTKADWITATQIAPNQWRAEVKLQTEYAPNITLSVAYVKNGEFVFQNQGLAVEQSRIELAIKPGKASYAPGETATVELAATQDGQPVQATLAVGVVDEMIYVLQPEIAPAILDFFYHPRRNNVRTTSTQAFIAYDLASTPQGAQPRRSGVPERAIKVLERPRREDVDTAYWAPTLKTDAAGKASISFRVPDSLTRWRITARAFDAAGAVGQKTAHLLSDKPYYVKWTSPDWLRSGDAPIASVAVFNNTREEQALELVAQGAGLNLTRKFNARPGANFVPISFGEIKAEADRQTPLTLRLSAAGKVEDSLTAPLATRAATFTRATSQIVELAAANALKLPAGARDVRAVLMSGAAAHFNRVADDLVAFPFGCVEQTASRMLPLTLALRSANAPAQTRWRGELTQRLATARVRLSFMAGANARFGWWGSHMSEDPFITTYAYYADWLATQALGQTLPAEHWQRLQEVYAQDGHKAPVAQRALMLHFMAQMGLPIRSLNDKLLQDLDQPGKPREAEPAADDSLPLGPGDSALALAFAQALAQHTAIVAIAPASLQLLKSTQAPLARALLVLVGQAEPGEAGKLLGAMAASQATIDRAVALVWLYRSAGGAVAAAPADAPRATLGAPWRARSTAFDQTAYRWPDGAALPTALALAGTPEAGAVAVIDYELPETAPGALAVKLSRQLFRLKLEAQTQAAAASQAPAGSGKNRVEPPEFTARSSKFTLAPVGEGEALSSTELYLEQIELQSTGARALRQGLVQIGLPPGASMEPSTWGMAVQFPGASAPTPLNRAVAEPTATGYAVPVQLLGDAPLVFTHLVRFSQKGSYTVPRARFHLMYQPGDVAHETSADKSLTRRVIVN
jgi:alpha-2-macroglobulin